MRKRVKGNQRRSRGIKDGYDKMKLNRVVERNEKSGNEFSLGDFGFGGNNGKKRERNC